MEIKSFRHWIVEQAESGIEPIYPTHDELSQLSWFQALERTLATEEIGVLWNTGKVAYAKGTRKLGIVYGRTVDDYTFYPRRGVVRNGAFSVKEGIPFDSMEAWNAALFSVYTRIVSGIFGHASRTKLENAIIQRDQEAIVRFFTEINRHLEQFDQEPRSDAFLFAILHEISTPEEAAVMRELLTLGLL